MAAAPIASLRLTFIWANLHAGHQDTALWGRGDLVEDAVEDVVREARRAQFQPRPDDALGIAIGSHPAASRDAGRASASRAARRPRIA